jgi:hypothetical protein
MPVTFSNVDGGIISVEFSRNVTAFFSLLFFGTSINLTLLLTQLMSMATTVNNLFVCRFVNGTFLCLAAEQPAERVVKRS